MSTEPLTEKIPLEFEKDLKNQLSKQVFRYTFDNRVWKLSKVNQITLWERHQRRSTENIEVNCIEKTAFNKANWEILLTFSSPANKVAERKCFHSCLCVQGVPCDHYPWCIGPHCTGPFSSSVPYPGCQKWDPPAPTHPDIRFYPPAPARLLMPFGGHH